MKNTGRTREEPRKNTGRATHKWDADERTQKEHRKNTGRTQEEHRKNTGRTQEEHRKNTRRASEEHRKSNTQVGRTFWTVGDAHQSSSQQRRGTFSHFQDNFFKIFRHVSTFVVEFAVRGWIPGVWFGFFLNRIEQWARKTDSVQFFLFASATVAIFLFFVINFVLPVTFNLFRIRIPQRFHIVQPLHHPVTRRHRYDAVRDVFKGTARRRLVKDGVHVCKQLLYALVVS